MRESSSRGRKGFAPQAAAAGQHDVQQDAVVVVCGDLVERRGVIGGLLDDVLLPGQRPDHDLPQGGFVFNNEYLHNTLLFLGTGGGAKIRS